MTNIDELARDIYDAFNDADPTSCIDPFALDQRIIIDGHFSMRAVAALLAVKMMERGLIGMSKPHNSPAREAVELPEPAALRCWIDRSHDRGFFDYGEDAADMEGCTGVEKLYSETQVRALLAAEHDMLMTGEELRICRAALSPIQGVAHE